MECEVNSSVLTYFLTKNIHTYDIVHTAFISLPSQSYLPKLYFNEQRVATTHAIVQDGERHFSGSF